MNKKDIERQGSVRIDRGHLTELRKARAEQLARNRGEKPGGRRVRGMGALPALGLLLGGTGLTLAGLHAKDKYIDQPKRRKKFKKSMKELKRVWTGRRTDRVNRQLNDYLVKRGHGFKDKKGKTSGAWNRNTDYGYKIYSPKGGHRNANLNKDGTMSVYDKHMNEVKRFR